MKKIYSILTLLLALILCLTSCVGSQGDTNTDANTDTNSPNDSEGSSESGSQATESGSSSESESATEPNGTTYPSAEVPKSLKILAIGNSFSTDGMQYLYQIAKSAGVEEIVLGNLYIGGCSLDTHYSHAKLGDGAYSYYKNTTGTWECTENVSLSTGIHDEAWDYITLQQTSKTSGLSSSYGNLTKLVSYVEGEKPSEDTKLLWHMTWAYQQDSTHSSFPNYDKSQSKMYQMIISATKECVLPIESLVGVIPTGTSIQNARTSFTGDTLTRDGYHLNYTLGRYIAGLTWFADITGADISDIAYVPSADVTAEVAAMAKDAVKDAVLKPYEVTQSTHKSGTWNVKDESFKEVVIAADCYESDKSMASGLGADLDNYVLLTYDYLENSYYNSGSNSKVTTPGESKSTYHQNVCTAKIYTKAEIPEGSIIICDNGWQYRPEKWITLDSGVKPRPDMVSAGITLIDATWWGDRNFCAINISSSPKSDISEFYAAAASHVRIYVPNNAK